MKIYQKPPKTFYPICIQLDSNEELKTMAALMRMALSYKSFPNSQNMETFTGVPLKSIEKMIDEIHKVVTREAQ